jgi:hypothetical protein
MKGSYIPKHKDPGKHCKVYRLNIELRKAKKGGEFKCKNTIWQWRNRIYCFRADANYHQVTPIEEGSRWVLSFGRNVKRN